MDAPKCRICGERHWGPNCLSKSSRGGEERQLKGKDPLVEDRRTAAEAKAVDAGRAICPVAAGARVSPSPRETKNESPGPYVVRGKLMFRLLDGSTISCECIAGPYAENIVSLWRGTGEKFNRTAYQREYMRKRRAKKAAP